MNADIRKRLMGLSEKAAKGPWTVTPCSGGGVILAARGDPEKVLPSFSLQFPEGADAEFIAAAREAVPELLDDVDRLEARVKELSNHATWRATINRLESAELEALAELDERIAENAALKARVAELEGEITELTAPFSSGDPTKLTESEWARIHENVEKYAPKTPHVQVDKDGVWFIRLDLFASITEKLEARVEKLEAVRERAAKLSGASIVEDLQPHWEALRAALARADKTDKEGQ